MKIKNSSTASPIHAKAEVRELIDAVSGEELRRWVGRLAVPRHFVWEPDANEEIGLWIAAQFQKWGYLVQMQGPWRNVLALPAERPRSLVLIGAHYDSVGGCPGADDNASAVAAMLGCAKACSTLPNLEAPAVCFAAFNREEEDLKGSRDFVEWLGLEADIRVEAAHVLEMVGFASNEPHSQRIPTGLPIRVPDVGNFLGLLANSPSDRLLEGVLSSARAYLPELPVIGLQVRMGLEKFLPVLSRSDHAPFWHENIPALMWTDTAEFRNPYYHEPGDKPETLNYDFLREVTRLLIACALESPPT